MLLVEVLNWIAFVMESIIYVFKYILRIIIIHSTAFYVIETIIYKRSLNFFLRTMRFCLRFVMHTYVIVIF